MSALKLSFEIKNVIFFPLAFGFNLITILMLFHNRIKGIQRYIYIYIYSDSDDNSQKFQKEND